MSAAPRILAVPALLAVPLPAAAAEDGTARSGSLCQSGEDSVLHALDPEGGDAISVCVLESPAKEEARISVRWLREGGMEAWSCRAGQCGGVLRYQRYTRPLTTYLRLRFCKMELCYAIDESFAGDDPDFRADDPPLVSISAIPPDRNGETAFSVDYSLRTERLGLMRLERFLENNPM